MGSLYFLTLLPHKKCPWDLVGMCRLTCAFLRIKCTHVFILITLLVIKNVIGTQWRCVG